MDELNNTGAGTVTEPQESATGTDDATGTQTAEKVTFDAAQQAHIDAVLGDRLKRAREKWESDQKKAQDKAQQAAEQKRLEEQQEYKKLADQHAAKVAELEPLAGQVERYKEALTKHLESARKDLPPHIITLLDKLDPVDQLAYITENADALGQPQAKGKDIDAGKTGTSKGKAAEVTDWEVEQFAANLNVNPKFVNREDVARSLGR